MSTKDSLRIIKAIVAHFDLELHQMDVRTTFLNGDLVEDVYISQPISFGEVGKENMVCKLQKFINGLKQASKPWYLKFDEVVTANGFKENVTPQNPGFPLTTRQPVEFLWISGNPIPHFCVPFIGIHIFTKIKQSLLCSGSSTQYITCITVYP